MEKPIFEELDLIYQQQYLENYNLGWDDYFNNRHLTEDITPDGYEKGYTDAEKASKADQGKQYILAHKEEILAKLKQIKR